MDDTGPVNLYDSLESWASKENRELHASIQKEQSNLHDLKTECGELNERVSILKEHLNNVVSEVANMQTLLTAKNLQVEEERHLTELVHREQGKIASDLVKLDERINKINDLQTSVLTKTKTSQIRIEQYREEARMNEDELEQWVMIARQKEEDFLVLQRYKREDEGRIRSMLLEIEKSTGIIEAKKSELENEVTATRALQIELDMTAEQFRQMHNERTELLQQWESTMTQMQQLNDRIEDMTEKFDKKKGDVDRLHIDVVEERKKLDAAETENQKIERQLTIGDHRVSQMHEELEKNSGELIEFNETVETQRHQLEKLESDEKFYNEEIQNFKNMTNQEVAKKQEYLDRLNQTENALSTQTDKSKEINELIGALNDFYKKEENNLKNLEAQIDAGKQSIFKLSQEVSSEKKKQRDLRAEMEGSQTRAKNLQLKIQDFDNETQKQMELLYNSNFQIQQMERKIARIEGERTEEEKVELQSQIDDLSVTLERKLEIEKVLSLQLHRLDLDLRQTTRKKEKLAQAQETLEIKLNEVRLDQDSYDKSTARARSQKENVLVQLNLLRLQVEKLTEQVNIKSNELVSLENRRQQLQLSMEERILEIDEHIAALKTQLKTEEEARHLSELEVKERTKRATTLESKYQIMMGKYQDNGQEGTQSQYIIKFIEERDAVSKRGDLLNQQVKEAAKELQQLEKAMNKLNNHNTEFRKGFTSVTESDNDMERKKVLEEQVRVAQQRLNARKTQANALLLEKREREKTYQHQEEIIEKMQREIMKIRPVVEKVTNENVDIKEKIARIQKILGKAREKHRQENNIPHNAKYPSTLLEMDVELRIEKLNVEMALNDINRIAEVNTEILPKLKLALTQMGIPIKSMSAFQKIQPPAVLPKAAKIISPVTSTSRSGAGSRGSPYSSTSITSRSSGSVLSNMSSRSRRSSASRRSAASINHVTLG